MAMVYRYTPRLDCVANKHFNDSHSSPSRSYQAEKFKLKFFFWNISGLTDEKLNDHIIGEFLKKHDIILINETWCGLDDKFPLEGYTFYNNCCLNRNHKGKCNSASLGVFVSDTIKHGVTIGKHHEDLIAWMVLDSTALGLVNDIHVANVYVPPEDSVHLPINAFETIKNHIADILENCETTICSDINAHTSTEPDYHLSIHGSEGDLDILLP